MARPRERRDHMVPQLLTLATARRLVPNAQYGETYCVEMGTWKVLGVGVEAARAAAEAAKADGRKTTTFVVTGKIEG
jgi:hypothetical protein